MDSAAESWVGVNWFLKHVWRSKCKSDLQMTWVLDCIVVIYQSITYYTVSGDWHGAEWDTYRLTELIKRLSFCSLNRIE